VHEGLLDVSGDSAGTILLTATNAVDVPDTLATVAVRADGISTIDNAADGGLVTIQSTASSVLIDEHVDLNGLIDGTGGTLIVQAGTTATIAARVRAIGGVADGGAVEVAAADDVLVSDEIDVSSFGGGGFGGEVILLAGGMSGGTVSLQAPGRLLANGSSAIDSGGDGGSIEVEAAGTVSFVGAVVVEANGAVPDGSGGEIVLVSADGDPGAVGPLDGDLILDGSLEATGSQLGVGGTLLIDAGDDLDLDATVDVRGGALGGEVQASIGGSGVVDETLRAEASAVAGTGGFVEIIAGNGRDAGLVIANPISTGSNANGSGGSILLAGCDLTVQPLIAIDGRGTVGGTIELRARRPMQLQVGSQYLATVGGSITTTHPIGQDPVIGGAVGFNPARSDNPDDAAPYPACGLSGATPTPTPSATDGGPTETATLAPTVTPTFSPFELTPTPTATDTGAGPTETPSPAP
jgi:hypothetical protein